MDQFLNGNVLKAGGVGAILQVVLGLAAQYVPGVGDVIASLGVGSSGIVGVIAGLLYSMWQKPEMIGGAGGGAVAGAGGGIVGGILSSLIAGGGIPGLEGLLTMLVAPGVGGAAGGVLGKIFGGK
jgi:hypothetical protein